MVDPGVEFVMKIEGHEMADHFLRRMHIAVICFVLLGFVSQGQSVQEQESPALMIGPGDVLEISVLGVDELSRKVRVLGDGTITLPLLGNFRITGFTVRDAEGVISRMLQAKELINEPSVSIFLAESVSGGVTIQGAVVNPGVHEIFGPTSLLEVLGRAGGLRKDRGGEILLFRRDTTSEAQSIQIPISKLMDEGDMTLNLDVRPGDMVIVPVGRTLRVYVTGAVRRPGVVEFSSGEGITVLQAITAAGGPTERANLKKVTLKRRLEDGTDEGTRINVKRIQKGTESDIPLQGNDTIVVGEWLL